MKKLLLIEDDPISGKFYADQFANADYYVEWSVDGTTGLSAMARLKPDVVVLSYYLPDISGKELIGQIRSQSDVGTPAIVALLRTGNDPEVAKSARKAGAHRTAVKLLDNVLKTIRESLEEASRAPLPVPALAAEMSESATAVETARALAGVEMPAEDPVNDLSEVESAPVEEKISVGPSAKLKRLSQALLRADNERERFRRALHLREEAERLASADCSMTARAAKALAALLKDLYKPDRITPSTLRTVHQTVELLEKLAEGASANLPAQSWKVLTVDDEVVARMTVARALALVGVEPEMAKNPAEAIELLKTKSYDLCVFDVNMPGMTGFELCEKLRGSRKHAQIPVIFVTAHSDFESRLRFARSGGDDFIAKPFIPSELAAKVLQHLLSRALGAGQNESIPLAHTVSTAPEKNNGSSSALPPPASQSSENHSPKSDAGFPCDVDPNRVITKLKVLSRSFVQAGNEATRLPVISDLQKSIELLASSQEVLISKFAQILLVLLKELYDSPDRITASTARTIQQAVELMDKLASHQVPLLDVAQCRILGVDDEVVARMTISKALALVQIEAETAKAPSEALALLRKGSYDLFILDVNMPEMNGYDLCEKLRSSRAHAKVPVIFATARSDFESKLRFARSGAEDFIAKPFLASELAVKALQHLLSSRVAVR